MADILKFDNTKFIENMVQQKPLYNTSGNVNCYKHFGKKIGTILQGWTFETPAT